jgi:hypothetical protein
MNEEYIDVKALINKHRVIWSILMIEYVTLFGFSLVHLINQLESLFQLQATVTVFMIFIEMHLTLGWEWVEDIIWGDMNTSYGFNKGFDLIIKDNIDNYFGAQIAAVVLIIL